MGMTACGCGAKSTESRSPKHCVKTLSTIAQPGALYAETQKTPDTTRRSGQETLEHAQCLGGESGDRKSYHLAAAFRTCDGERDGEGETERERERERRRESKECRGFVA